MKKKESNYTSRFCFSALFYVVMAAMFICGLISCSSDETVSNEPDEGLETVEVPISITMGRNWEIDTEEDTRALPPGVGIVSGDGNISITETSDTDAGLEEIRQVNEVKIMVFRRMENSGEDFEYDASNEQECEVKTIGGGIDDSFGDKNLHRIAYGSLKKMYGYEYKVIAVAYTTQPPTTKAFTDLNGNLIWNMKNENGDLDRFHFNVDKNHLENIEEEKEFSSFRAIFESEKKTNTTGWQNFHGGLTNADYISENAVLTGYVADPPQLFYGECYTENNGVKTSVIKYSENTPEGESIKTLPLEGILFRGMAKVELHVNVSSHVNTGLAYNTVYVSLLANNVLTEVGLTAYDDFLHGDKPVSVSGKAAYTVVGYHPVTKEESENKKEIVIETYLLPCKTKLLLRSGYDSNSNILGDNMNIHPRNAILFAKDEDYNVGNGTGIISPLTHDGEFYLRRNHKYVIKINDLESFLTNKMYNDSSKF